MLLILSWIIYIFFLTQSMWSGPTWKDHWVKIIRCCLGVGKRTSGKDNSVAGSSEFKDGMTWQTSSISTCTRWVDAMTKAEEKAMEREDVMVRFYRFDLKSKPKTIFAYNFCSSFICFCVNHKIYISFNLFASTLIITPH